MLNLDGTPGTTKSGEMIAGPVFEAALRLGFGPGVLGTPRNRSILAYLGIAPELALVVGRTLRARSPWRAVWEELAKPHLDAVEAAYAQGDRERTVREIHDALGLVTRRIASASFPMPRVRRHKHGLAEVCCKMW